MHRFRCRFVDDDNDDDDDNGGKSYPQTRQRAVMYMILLCVLAMLCLLLQKLHTFSHNHTQSATTGFAFNTIMHAKRRFSFIFHRITWPMYGPCIVAKNEY